MWLTDWADPRTYIYIYGQSMCVFLWRQGPPKSVSGLFYFNSHEQLGIQQKNHTRELH